MWQEGVAGFLLWPAMTDTASRFLQQTLAQSAPVVFMDRPIPGLNYPCVATDHYQGAVLAVEHLIGLGHRDITFVSRPHLDLWPIAERLRGYESAMRAAGLTPRPPLLVGQSAELPPASARRAYQEARGQEISELQVLLRQPERPTAIFAMNDLMALQVLRAATLTQLKIPDELSVVGFDDLEIVSHVEPPLTTVVQDPFSMGAEAARCLIDMVHGNRPADLLNLLPARLIVRASTGAAQRGQNQPE